MTLTQAVVLTKKSIFIGGILIFLIVVITVGYNIWHTQYLASLPKPVEKPEEKFGTLPALPFPATNVSSSNYSYNIDTVTGDLPQTPTLMKVYFIAREGMTLLAPEKSQKLASQLGFTDPPQRPSQTTDRYIDTNGDTLDIDLITGNFHYRKAAEATGSGLVVTQALPKGPDIIAAFKNFLTSANLLPDDINPQGSVVFNSLPATATVSFLPKNLDNIPIVTDVANEGLIKATAIGTTSNNPNQMFLAIDYTYWPVDQTTSSTYPLKTARQALSDLKSGKGFISEQPGNPQVSITTVSMAYYEPDEYTPYLQPVFVFSGPGFQALVPAVGQ